MLLLGLISLEGRQYFEDARHTSCACLPTLWPSGALPCSTMRVGRPSFMARPCSALLCPALPCSCSSHHATYCITPSNSTFHFLSACTGWMRMPSAPKTPSFAPNKMVSGSFLDRSKPMPGIYATQFLHHSLAEENKTLRFSKLNLYLPERKPSRSRCPCVSSHSRR